MSRFARKKFLLFVLAGSAGVVAAAVLSVLYGSTDIPVSKIWQALTAPDLTDQQQIITYELRIPRTLGLYAGRGGICCGRSHYAGRDPESSGGFRAFRD